MATVNAKATTFGPAPSVTNVTTPVHSPALVVEIPTPASEVDQIANIVATLSLVESTSPPVST